MKTDDLFIFITSELLKAPAADFDSSLEMIKEEFNNLELEVPQKPEVFSVGATDKEGELYGYVKWIQDLRQDYTGHRFYYPGPSSENKDLPLHMAAAFANGAPGILEVSLKKMTKSYMTLTAFSKELTISGRDFVRFIDSVFKEAHHTQIIWSTILEKEVKRYPDADSRHIEDAKKFVEKQVDHPGSTYFVASIIQMIQEYSVKEQLTFNITDDLQEYFYQEDPDEMMRKQFEEQNPGRENEFLAESELLTFKYQAANSNDYVTLIEAQKEGDEIWSRVKDELELFITHFSEDDSPASIREVLLTLTDNEFHSLPAVNIIMVLQQYLKTKQKNIIVPEALKDKIELADERHSVIKPKDVWKCRPNTQPWQMLIFSLIQDDKAQTPRSEEVSEVKDSFEKVLKKAEAFSARVESPFMEAFKLSHWVLTNKSTPWSGQENFLEAMKKAHAEGFSEMALDQLSRHEFLAPIFKGLKTSEEICRGMIATGIADLFGGMGSWNDQAFGSEEDNKEYSDVSVLLFEALRKFRAEVLLRVNVK